jgi:3-oxoacyl-[acyl-carrier-protein] synthase III
MAGRESEIEFFGSCLGGDDDDRRQITLMLKEIGAVSKESRLRKKTRALVKRHRIKVEAIARELIKSKRLSARKIDAIIRRTSSPSELAIAKRVYNSADRVKMRERFS